MRVNSAGHACELSITWPPARQSPPGVGACVMQDLERRKRGVEPRSELGLGLHGGEPRAEVVHRAADAAAHILQGRAHGVREGVVLISIAHRPVRRRGRSPPPGAARRSLHIDEGRHSRIIDGTWTSRAILGGRHTCGNV